MNLLAKLLRIVFEQCPHGIPMSQMCDECWSEGEEIQ